MRRLALALVALAVFTGVSTEKQATERQRAVHALNRLAFGARPGDVDKVVNEGVDAWIDQQLHPETIADRAVETRLCQLPTLEMTNADIVSTYYTPIQQARREKKAGEAIDSEQMKMFRQK